MNPPESAAGVASAASWKTYSVSRADKAPLLRFVMDALEMRGCTIVHASEPSVAPFYIVFDSPSGERHGVLVYAFFANSKITNNRPEDERRFQIKYGGQLKGVLDVAIDPTSLITTIFLGIDPVRRIFVAGDPIMNNPSPMSRSIEFKEDQVQEILRTGWVAWERDRRAPKTQTRPTPPVDDDTRIQVLVGGKQERLLDLIQLERIGRGLDPGERHLLADKLAVRASESSVTTGSHKLLDELGVSPDALFDLIDGASRLKMAVRGWVAETYLVGQLSTLPGVSDCVRLEGDGLPDVSLRWKGSAPILVECKNVLRKLSGAGQPRVDFQRTRASKQDPCSRYYRPSDFCVLAACLHAVTDQWAFRYAITSELPEHGSCLGRIASNIVVREPEFVEEPSLVFAKCSTMAHS